MTDQLLDLLRCPFDPSRTARLLRDQTTLVCERCHTTFPIRAGIPILLMQEAQLPENITSPAQLACRRTKNQSRS